MEQAAKDAPAEPGAVNAETTLRRVHRTMDNVDRFIGDRNVVASAHVSNATPAAPWHVWVCVGAVFLAVLVASNVSVMALGLQQRVTDLRGDMQTERINREISNKWTAQEVTAIRSYITTGKLAPMSPPPTAEKGKP